MTMKLLDTNTESDDATSSFTSGIDSTYKLYIFKFIDIHPESTADLVFQCSIDGGSNYNVTTTNTHFRAYHLEGDGAGSLDYQTGADQAQGTAFNSLISSTIVNDNDASGVGTLWLFNPSNTTYVKHYYFEGAWMGDGAYAGHAFASGYFNDTNDINAIQFKMSTGNMNGTIKMYGVK